MRARLTYWLVLNRVEIKMLKTFAVAVMLALAAVAATAEEFKEGQHYEMLSPAQPTSTGDKIEVVELFWYGCPHCYAFEPDIAAWLERKAPYIAFVRVPAVFAKNWEVHARAYYAAEQLGVLEKIHKPLFAALHDEKRKLFSEDELAEFFAEHGVTEEAFHAAFDSFDVDTKTRHAIALTRSYGVSGVPSIIVNGKYRSSAQQAGDYDHLLKLVDFLADKEHDR